MPRQVDYYFSIQSPWAYIGHKFFREVTNTYDLKVNHKPVVLVDLFSETGGLPLLKRHPVRQRYRMLELQRWRDKRGLNFHLQPANWPFNARLADGVVIAAIEAGRDPDAFMQRAFAAVWEDQLNLADPATLVKIADDSGLPGQRLVERSGSEEISAAYEQNRQDALAADVFGSPVYVLDGEVFWGQDRIELLADALKSGRAPYRSPAEDRAQDSKTGSVLRQYPVMTARSSAKFFTIFVATAVISCVAFSLGGIRGMGAAAAQPLPDAENGRYALSPVADGVIRLDTRTGAVSTCTNTGNGWACYVVPDERAALEAKIGGIQDDNKKLRAKLAAREPVIPGKIDEPLPKADSLKKPEPK